jgi:hypothetical protein
MGSGISVIFRLIGEKAKGNTVVEKKLKKNFIFA